MWYDATLRNDVPTIAPAGIMCKINIDPLNDPIKCECYLNTKSCDALGMDWDARQTARHFLYDAATAAHKQGKLADLFDMTPCTQNIACPKCGSTHVAILPRLYKRMGDDVYIHGVRVKAECICGEVYDITQYER